MRPELGVEIANGLKHREDVFRRDVRQDVVDLLEDESSTGSHDPDVLPHMASHLRRRPMRQDESGIAPPAPEDQIPAELPLQSRQLHVLAVELHRIDGIQACIDHVRKKRPDSTAAVEADLDAGTELLRMVPQHRMPGLEEFTVHPRGNLWSRLHPQVVAEPDDVDEVADRAQIRFHVGHVVLGQAVEEGVDAIWIRGDFIEEVVDPEQEFPDFDEIASEGAVDRSLRGGSQGLGAFPSDHPPGSVQTCWGGGDPQSGPHDLLQVVRKSLEGAVVAIRKGKAGLFEEVAPVLLDADDLSFVASDQRSFFALLHLNEGGDSTGSPVL